MGINLLSEQPQANIRGAGLFFHPWPLEKNIKHEKSQFIIYIVAKKECIKHLHE